MTDVRAGERRDLTIGDFAALTRLSIRSLRRYHEAGLLEPSRVDDATGYRYYDGDQIRIAQVIHQLRQLDVPLAEVSAILRTDDPVERAQAVSAHLARLEAELERTRTAVASLHRLLEPDRTSLQVELRSVPERTVAAVTDRVDVGEVVRWFDQATDALRAAVHESHRAGALAGRYDNDLFTRGRGRATVFFEVAQVQPEGRVRSVTLPPTELATVVHVGTHDDIDVTYGRLGEWVARHALTVDGPIEERYLRGPTEDEDPAT